MDVKNGTLGTIEKIRGGTIQARLDNGGRCAFDAGQYPQFNHGYASTVHKLQGATVDRCFALADPLYDRHTALAALTRHRQDVHLHWSREQFADFDRLKKTLTRERPKLMALDFCAARGIEPAKEHEQIREKVRWSRATDRIADLAAPLLAQKGDVDAQKRIDATVREVRRHLAAMGCERYDVSAHGMTRKKKTREDTWTAKEVEQAVPSLMSLNARGNEIYIRPAGDEAHGLILASGVNEDTLEKFRRDGLDPALVVHLGPHLRHVWIKLSEPGRVAPPEAQKSIIAERAIETYGLSAKQVSTDLYAHLSGFSLHRGESKDKMPVCTVGHDSGQVASGAERMFQELAQERQRLEKQYEGQYFNVRIGLADGRSVEKTLKIEELDPEQKREVLNKEAQGLILRTITRERLRSDEIDKLSCTVAKATPEQVKSFERERARSRERYRGPGLGM